MKRFNYKVYNSDWTFKQTIKENEVLNEFWFALQKNWWQGQFNLQLNRDYSDVSIVKYDFIKVYLYDDNFPNGKLIYTWVIEEIERNYQESENSLTLVCRWLASLLTRFYYNQTWYTFTKTDTASNIIKSIITYFNTKYSWAWINDSWIVDTVWRLSIDFELNTCFEAINKVVELTDSFWYIWADGTFYFNTTPTNIFLTAQKDVQNLDINEDSSEIINSVIVNYNWCTYTDTDATSITDNGLFEKQYTKSDLWLTEATDFATEILADNQTKLSVSLEVNNNYIHENLKPWDLVKIRNINYNIVSQIEKIDYNINNSTIYLDKFDSIGKVLKQI